MIIVIFVIIGFSVISSISNSMTNLDSFLIVITVDRALASGASRAGVEEHVAALGMTSGSG